LIVDGVLDHGRTIAKARSLLTQAGASAVLTALLSTRAARMRWRPPFRGLRRRVGFIIGYGMDDAGAGRGLPTSP